MSDPCVDQCLRENCDPIAKRENPIPLIKLFECVEKCVEKCKGVRDDSDKPQDT